MLLYVYLIDIAKYFYSDPINLCRFVITSHTFGVSGESEIPSVRPTSVSATITKGRDDVRHHPAGLSAKHKPALVTVAINCRKTQ